KKKKLTLLLDLCNHMTNTSSYLTPVASRFKVNKKYIYQYTTESRNGVVGTANLRNGPKMSCEVEIEIPQVCSFILHTRDCALSEVSVMDPQGQPVYTQAPGSDAFKAAMEKNPLKFTDMHLYPEEDEPVNILNIKRGIISALMVPLDSSSLPSTVHGACPTEYTVDTTLMDVDVDVTLTRDLSKCDQFYSREQANSPLAILQKLHRPMSKLISSTQKCNYQFDKKGKHIISAMCTEDHIYLPFSHEVNGISSVVTQELSFQSSKRINNRVFGEPFHFEDPEDKAPVQTKDAALNTMRDLLALAGTDQGQKRTGLFHKLVSNLRILRNETLSQTVAEMLQSSKWLTWQALLQCGTSECTSAVLQAIRTIDGVSLEVDALVYALGLRADPDAATVRDMLSMAEYKQSRAIMYALAMTVRNGGLMEVYRDTQNPVEKRIAAYLILMKHPDQDVVTNILNDLENESEDQFKNFVVSHLIWKIIESALTNQLSNTVTDCVGQSCHHTLETSVGSVRSNIIFDDANTLPKEVMLETTLRAFDYDTNIFEVGIDGTGFQPTIDALFGQNGFFPDSISKIMYWAQDNSQMLRDVLDRINPEGNRMKRQVRKNFHNIKAGVSKVGYAIFQKLKDDLDLSPTPEATAYLRFLGNEMGYVKTSDILRHLFALSAYFPQALFALTSSTDNEVFGHYIFMENSFCLPTASGFPLKFSLAGVFAPGAKGGLTYTPRMGQLSFMPSVGLEFITQMGVHIPDYVDAGLEMHTNMHHESSLNTKITFDGNQIKLSIPSPTTNTQLFSISNKLLSVSSGQTKIVPSLVEDRTDSTDCQPLFSGLNLCTIVRYSNASSNEQAPYYPLTGETRFAVEIQPTGEVSEYTATITHDTLTEGTDGQHNLRSLKLTLKAEGSDSTEATATLKYNPRQNTVITEIVIPDYDVEAGIKLAVTDSDFKGKAMRGITIDVTNKNIPQLSLVGRTRLEMMKDAMVQLQLAIPSMNSDASVTATLKKDEGVILDLETAINLPETVYQQKASLKYDDDKFEVELKSDMNADVQSLIPNANELHSQLQQLIDDMLDQQVTKTDMKLRHIVTKGIEAGNIWVDKLTARFPYLANLRSKRSLSDLTLPDLPEKLSLQLDSAFRYQFNKDKMTITIPLPLGGKTSEELDIPTTLSVPVIDLTTIGLYIPANTYRVPSFTIPPSIKFAVPLLGLAEASTKINSNFYSWEGSVSGGNNTEDVPSYVAQYKIMGQSPFSLLSYKLEGTGMMSGTPDDNLKYLVNSSFSHDLIETSFSVSETLRVTDKLNARANYKTEVTSPLGLQGSLFYSAQATSSLDSDEVAGDGTLDGALKIGSFYIDSSYTQSYNLQLLNREGRGESNLRFSSPFIQFNNMIQGVYANSELNIVSKTNAQNDILKHIAELKYKDAQLTLKSNALATALGKSLNNKVELGVSRDMGVLRIESQADDEGDATNRIYSLITSSLNSNGLEVNSEGSLIFNTGRGLHKAYLMIDSKGLTTSGTNNIQCSPVTLENVFNGAIDNSGATLSSTTKAMAEESRGELNIEGKITASEASLYGVLKGHAYDATTRNNMKIVLNKQALTFTADTMGSLRQMKTENSQALTLTLWTLSLRSKSNNFICEDVFYKQDTKVNMKPFIMSADMTNDLKIYDASLNNEVHMKLEPTKVDVSGSMKGAYGEEHNIKHTYEISFAGMDGALKYSTSASAMDAHLSHSCELEFAGLSSKSYCEAKINSRPLRFDSTIRTVALPFSLTIDGLVNSDGEINLPGKHTGQLYNKLLVKAEPMALAYSYDSRVSTTHMLSSGESSTHLENKFDGLLTPLDQILNWKLKSMLNDHTYNQDFSAYNNLERVGAEFSGLLSTDIFSRLSKQKRSVPESQEFSMNGFLKYDKNTDCHIIEIPFIESFPAAFDQLKTTLVQALESLQHFIHNLDINQMITDFRDMLDQLPVQVNDFMQNLDLDNKVNAVKEKLDYLTGEFAVTLENVADVMITLKENFEGGVMFFAGRTRDLILTIRDYLESEEFVNSITNVLQQIGDQLWAFDEMKQSLIRVLSAVEDVLSQIDLQKLTENSVSWLQELDSKYGILDKIKDMLSEVKQAIENVDITTFLQDAKDYILSKDLAMYFDKLSYEVPFGEIHQVIESMFEVIFNWVDEYEIPDKLNAVFSYIMDQIMKYNLDSKFKDLMDQVVILIKDFKIGETLQAMVDTLKGIKYEYVHEKIMEYLQIVTNQLRSIEFKKSIDELNDYLSAMLQSVKEFDYNTVVDETNKKIAELTDNINEQIKTYEIVQKIEAVREFFREIQNSVYTYLDGLKDTKVADALKKLKNVIDTTFYNDIKLKAQDILEDMRQRISDMDIRDEMYIYLERASESYTNIIAFISTKINQMTQNIVKAFNDSEIFKQMKEAIDGILDALTRAEIEIPTFTVPLTDLVVPALTINLNKLQEISIPAQISIPEFTILNSYTVPGFTIDFNEIKEKLIEIIDEIKAFELQTPDPEEIFGDLKVLYLSELPDLTFPEITLSEIKFPTITIPKLSLEDFEITTLPIPEITLPAVPSDICIPVFGKLHGEFRLNSPQYTLVTTGRLENSTSAPKNPQFTATINSEATSTFEPLAYTLEAIARLEAPRMKKMLFTETLKVTHMAFSIDHEGSLTLTSSSAEAVAKTVTKATTQMYTAELDNNMMLTLRSGISGLIDTVYNHNLDIPSIETSSQVSVKQTTATTLESGQVTVTSETTSNGKWSIQDFSDEGVHKSKADFNINFNTAKLSFEAETDSKFLKSKQTLTAESVILSHFTVEAKSETEVPTLRKSIASLNGEAHLGDLKLVLTASHNAEFLGSVKGVMSNSLEFMAHPFEVLLDVKNKVNSKVFLPLKLTGKVDFQNDYGVILNSEKQRACWFALARFNQYKYNHNFTMENNDLDMTVPYLEMNTPVVREFSLWDDAGLKNLLTTPQQSFEMNLKLHYFKNPESHSIDLPLEPVYNVINDYANFIQAQFEQCRDKIVELLKDSHNQAKMRYYKHKKDTSSLPPRIFTISGYKIPILNIEVSAFRAELPAFSYVVPKEVSTPSFKIPALGFSVPSYTLVLPSPEFPVIHVPDTLSKIELPTFTLPAIQNNILIPAMGNITLDFNFKSVVMALSANAGLYNQSDIVARFGASSTSVFNILNGKVDGTTSLTGKRGIKLATTVSLEHPNVEANHECTVSLSKRSMETSVANTAKINFPFLYLEFDQEITGNTKTKPNVASKKKVKYMFNIPLIESAGKGNLDMNWELEALSTYVSLESSTQGKSDITIMDNWSVVEDLENKVTFYLNANGLRSTFNTIMNSNIDKQENQKRSTSDNIFHFDVTESFALELSLRRMFATVDYTSNNNIDLISFSTNGKHVVKGELDFVPLTSLKTILDIDASQPSSLGHVGLVQNINLGINSEKQSLSWSGKEQLASLIHACDFLMSNDESEIRMDLTESVEGYLAFLKSVKLPVYQKTIWDVLKFDQVTNMDNLQFLNISSSVVYTKSMDGEEYAIPSKLFENGVTFSIPEINVAVPDWVKEIPRSISNIDMRLEQPDVPESLTLPPKMSIPAFDVPFTNLHVEPFTIDPQNVNIPKVITTSAFDIMLPGLPVMSVPSYEINTEYLQGKMSFLSFKMPQYELTVSSFTLPKSFTIGENTIDLDEIGNHIANLELPTIVIPEQKIEIPEFSLHLPSSVFIPSFGALSASLKVSSPIYNVSSIANMEKKDSSLVTSLNSICTSTMIFLEYDLTASAILGFDNGILTLNGKSELIHKDVNVNWQHSFQQNLRMKRQASSPDTVVFRHTLIVDVTSPTFVDVGFRFTSRKDGITASMSSPSSGFLGLHLQRRSPSQLYGKLFIRYQSTPEKDTDIFTVKATLRNSQKLTLQTSWNLEALHSMTEGAKDKIPAINEALLKFINKYHTAHFGFDLNRGGMKLKNTVSNVIERAYHEFPLSFNTLQNSVENLSDQGMDMYRRASDGLMSINVHDVADRLSHGAKEALTDSEERMNVLFSGIRRFLSDTRFRLPGSEEQLSGLEMFNRARRSLLKAKDRAVQRFESLMRQIVRSIREIQFRIPGTEVTVNGNEIVDEIISVFDQIQESVQRWAELFHKNINEFLTVMTEKIEDFINYLKDENREVASRFNAIYTDMEQSSRQQLEEAQRHVAEYKDLTKVKIQEAYNAVNMERINEDTKEFISIVQSHLNNALSGSIDLMTKASEKTAPYVKVGSKKLEIEIPLPFMWKSFSEWPTSTRQ
uniref:Apolipoprotein Ba n=1 Tax=Sphaeramia orbicularis TaxID=375764 RepID=A0A672YEF9_9TELE